MDDLSNDRVLNPDQIATLHQDVWSTIEPSTTYARLEVSPEDAARRHLGAAVAVGSTRELTGRPFVHLPADRRNGLVKAAVAVFAVAALGTGTWFMLQRDAANEVAVATLTPLLDAGSLDAEVENADRQELSSPIALEAVEEKVLISPEVLTAAPEVASPVLAESVFTELSQIEPVLYVGELEPSVLPKLPSEDAELIVFLEVPKRVEVLQPSRVEPPELPSLATFASDFSVFDPPAINPDNKPNEVTQTPVFLASVTRDRLPTISVEVPALLRVTPETGSDTPEPNLAARTDDTDLPLIITTYQPVEIAAVMSTSRVAPSVSLRPSVAPANRQVLAATQIGRRKSRSTPVKKIGQAIQVEVAVTAPAVREEAGQRPQLIEPKRRGLQRLFKRLGSQKVTTIEKFADENNN